MNPRKLGYSVIGTIIFLEVLSVATTDSIWPWAVLFHESLLLKILGWYLTVQSVLVLWICAAMRLMISDDKECPICHHNLKDYIAVFGPPVICHRCRTFFHQKCFIGKNKRCPVCYPESEDTGEIPHDFRSNIPRSTSGFGR